MYSKKEDIENFLKKNDIEKYEILEDLTVNVFEDVFISNNDFSIIPVKFGTVKGFFDCTDNKLTSLKNCPIEVESDFICSRNKLKSLKHCPQKIGGAFECSANNIKSLKYSPEEVDGDFSCFSNHLTSLRYFPNLVTGILSFENNNIKKEDLHLFKTIVKESISSDFGKDEKFLKIVLEQKAINEKEKLSLLIKNEEEIKIKRKKRI